MRIRLAVALFAIAALSTACAPRRIPGTDIEDTSETRQILNVMEKYRAAVEAKDAEGVLNLVSENFKDDAGTTTPEDDITYAELKTLLPERVGQLDDVKLDINVRKIQVEGDLAQVIYYYNSSYRIPSLTPRPQSDSDLQQMLLKKVGDQWRITSGI